MNKMLLRGMWLVGLGVIAGQAFGQLNGPVDPARDFVATDKNAYLMLPPSVICGPSIKEAIWSTDGERLLIWRNFTDLTPELAAQMILPEADRKDPPPPFEAQVLSWSTVTRKTSALYHLSEKDGIINEVNWMAGSSSAVVVATFYENENPEQHHTNLMLVNTSGAVKNVAPVDVHERYSVDVSPYGPRAAFIEYPPYVPTRKGDPPAVQNPASLRFFSFDGVLGQSFRFPGPNTVLMWSQDGRAYALTFVRDERTKTTKRAWAFANSSTHKFEPCDAPKDSGFGAADPTLEVNVVSLSAKASFKKLGVNAPTIVAVASDESKDNDPGVVTTDGQDAALSPKLNAVVFISQESLLVRPMVKVSLDAYHKAKDLALRAQLLSRAKQIGLALIMYAGDYDDNLPSNQGNWSNLIQPYMKDTSIGDGFNYTYNGGNMDNIDSPADTSLGYFEGPGGRAYVYSDGHAKWVPNP